jgi:transposase-like protein
MKKKRNFTVEEKVQILREAEEHGVLDSCRKFNIVQSLFTGGKIVLNSLTVVSKLYFLYC